MEDIEGLSRIHNWIKSSEFSPKVFSFVQENAQSKKEPFLSVLPLRSDPFLVDQAPLRLEIRPSINDKTEAEATILTYNREVYDRIGLRDLEEDLNSSLEMICNGNVMACQGFDSECCDGIFEKIRKTDIGNLLIQKYKGDIVFRARKCSYVISKAEDKSSQKVKQHCEHCETMVMELDMKYCAGRFFAPQIVRIEGNFSMHGNSDQGELANSRLRGAKKIKGSTPSQNQDLAPFAEIKLEEEKGIKEDAKVDKNDEIFMVRKSSRKRISKTFENFNTKLTRGRPSFRKFPSKCDQCEESFETITNYRAHTLLHTNPFACKETGCFKRFKEKENLDIHIRKHRGEKPFVCPSCDETFDSRSEYNKHKKNHSDLKSFKCNQCPKTFKRPQQLKNHIVVHTGERSYLCDDCGNSFGNLSTLIDHRKRIHFGIRDHKCKECEKGFFTRNELEAHERTHTGVKPFPCKHCGKSFARSHHLKRHIQAHIEPKAVKLTKPRPSKTDDNASTIVITTSGDEQFGDNTNIVLEDGSSVNAAATYYLILPEGSSN